MEKLAKSRHEVLAFWRRIVPGYRSDVRLESFMTKLDFGGDKQKRLHSRIGKRKK